MNADQKPNGNKKTSHQTSQAGQKKDISAGYSAPNYSLKASDNHASNALLSNNSLIISSVLDRPAMDKVRILDAFDWKTTISDTYFDLDVSFRQPNKFSGFLQHAKLLDIGVSHYHANTVH